MNGRRSTLEYRFIASPGVPGRELPARLLAMAEGWAMVRRPRAVPFVIPAEQWETADVCKR